MDNLFKDKIQAIVKASNEFYKNKLAEKNSYTEVSNTIDDELRNAIKDALVESYRLSHRQHFSNQDEYLDTVLEACIERANQPNINTKRFSQIRTNHLRMANQHTKITDEIAQAVKHDWYDKLRFLLFRILTTIGIAGAAIGAAIYTNSLGYETALIKKKSPEAKVAEVLKAKELTPKLTVRPTTVAPDDKGK